jgi:beta-glucosidase
VTITPNTKKDIELIAELGHNAHRISLEWSRIEPKEGVWSEEALDHYEDVLVKLHGKQIQPIVTLHHFTSPCWLADKGGWENPEVQDYFERFTEKVVGRLGKYVKYWITINEPMVYIYHGHYEGIWPPFKKSLSSAATVCRNMLHAHVRAYRVLHAYSQNELGGQEVQVSISKSLIPFEPVNEKSLKDKFAVFLRNWFYNHLFLKSLKTGFAFFPGLMCEFLPAKNTLDFLGINYYFRQFVKSSKKSPFGEPLEVSKVEGRQNTEINQMRWEVYPKGIVTVVEMVARYGWPVMITENGICTKDDTQRVRYIETHLASLLEAKKAGANVIGYLYWSLFDNFEWAEGYSPCFGIVEVNLETQERKIKKSAHVLTEICRKVK